MRRRSSSRRSSHLPERISSTRSVTVINVVLASKWIREVERKFLILLQQQQDLLLVVIDHSTFARCWENEETENLKRGKFFAHLPEKEFPSLCLISPACSLADSPPHLISLWPNRVTINIWEKETAKKEINGSAQFSKLCSSGRRRNGTKWDGKEIERRSCKERRWDENGDGREGRERERKRERRTCVANRLNNRNLDLTHLFLPLGY